jgi:hypothetical protein
MKLKIFSAIAIASILLPTASYATSSSSAAAVAVATADTSDTTSATVPAVTAADAAQTTNTSSASTDLSGISMPVFQVKQASLTVAESKGLVMTNPLLSIQTSVATCQVDPMSCVQNPSKILSGLTGTLGSVGDSIKAVGQQQLDAAKKALTDYATQFVAQIGSQIAGALGINFGSSGTPAPVTHSQIDLANKDGLTNSASMATQAQAALNMIALNSASTGEFIPGQEQTATVQSSRILGNAVTSVAGQKDSTQIIATSANAVSQVASGTAPADDSLTGINRLLALQPNLAQQNDLIIGELNAHKILAAQQLNQSASNGEIAKKEAYRVAEENVARADENLRLSKFISGISNLEVKP